MIAAIVAATIAVGATALDAQVTSPPTSPSTLPGSGAILRATVIDVAISTTDESGPYTAFLIRPPEQNSQSAWFLIRNDDINKSLERGAMIGLLMGAAQANRWGDADAPPRLVNIRYETVRAHRIITGAALANRLGVPR